MWGRAFAHATVAADTRLATWLEAARTLGIVARLADDSGAAALLGNALDVLGHLPAEGVRLERFAADVTGDPHALDRSTPLGSLVTHALAHVAGSSSPGSALQWRSLWARAGVACDDLACDVLVLNLRVATPGAHFPTGAGRDDLLAGTLRDFADAGEPVRLTLGMLLRTAVTAPAGSLVFVCANPAVVAHAAESLGSRCAALVCIDGAPNTAARVLLERVVAGGAQLAYHGDFDWGGVRIGNLLMEHLGARPWRFASTDYRDSLARLGRGSSGVTLAGPAVSASWDPDLAVTMAAAGVALFEEQVLDDLAADLAGSHSGGGGQGPNCNVF